MAIRLIDRYPTRANPANTDYPHGSGRNKTGPTAVDGTPFDEARYNDHEALFQSLLESAEVTPNNTPDTVPASQYADALSVVANGLIVIDVGGSADATLDYNQARVHGFRLTGALAGDISVIVPDTERMYTVVNDATGDFDVTVKTALGTGVEVGQGQTFVVRCDGADVVRGVDSQRTIYVGSVAELVAMPSFTDGARYECSGFRSSTKVGGGAFIWSVTEPKANHNGIDIIDPERPFPSDFSASAEISVWTSAASDAGNGCFIRLNEEKVPTTACGIYPDDGIDYRANGLLNHILQTASGNRFHLLVKSGRYDSAWDNYYSDLSVTFEKGAFFTGTIHVAINTSSDTPAENRPKNVNYYGDVGTYNRVGWYNCDNIYTERVVIKSDPLSASITSRGVHIYLDAKGITVDEVYVEAVDSNADYAFGIDGSTTHKPDNVRIGKLRVRDSNTHGVYLMGSNVGIDSITVDAYGAGEQTTAIPLATAGESAALKGLWCNRLTGGSYINHLKIRQGTGTRANADDGAYCDDGDYHIGVVDISGATARGLAIDAQVETPLVSADRVRSVGCGGINVAVQKGSLSCGGDVISSGSASDGIFVNEGATLRARTAAVNDEAGTAAMLVSGTLVCDEVSCGAGSGGDKHLVKASGKIIANRLRCSTGTIGAIGGAYFVNSKGSKIEKIELVNVGTATAAYAALHLENTTNMHIGACEMSDGLGNGLRLITVADCSFNGFDISGYDQNVAASGVTRIGFMNCYNHAATTTLTNLGAASAEFFNAPTMHT